MNDQSMHICEHVPCDLCVERTLHKELIEIEVLVPDGFKAIAWRQVTKGELYLHETNGGWLPLRYGSAQKSARKYVIVTKV